ncbi:hypothetical protein E2562_030874 [Oryza meyeriana var. granulata]|uniref:Reverse transcriptase/retrotransposon-derived protein RNase H-like domain-containing protein n=1 Tax=Oryza meyeriana var. granulata TaxID=110450 RepID=A0A6G1F002_9ORYZ|nr:hypothetical protein E2562_030874 [Oryza meyeriana var. granulata]
MQKGVVGSNVQRALAPAAISAPQPMRVGCLPRRHQRLFFKRFKCFFGVPSVVYLGHVILGDGVAMDVQKVQAIFDWPTPRSVHALRGFLGLTGYYRLFIQGFDTLAASLTNLLKRVAFAWTEDADRVFHALQHALTSALTL